MQNLPTPMPRYAPASTEEPDTFAIPFDHLAGTQLDLQAMQDELDAMKEEINLLRRRDETLQFYMTRLDEELRLAAKLQQDFLPKQLPQVGPLHFHTLFRPAGYVSGDLYDVMRLDENHIGFFLVDAVGHGMPAALLTMFMKRALICKEIDPTGYHLLSPGETMRRLNEALVEQNLSQATFCTAIYGIINANTLELTVASGGHPAPLLLRESAFTEVPVEGPLLGIFPGETYIASKFQLKPGDRLLIYSDGIEVAFNVDLGLHQDLWKQELAKRIHLSPEGMLIDFADTIDRETGSLAPKDDLTLLLLDVK